MAITAVILTHNHELCVAKAICQIKESLPDADILVADTFSEDNTIKVAEAFGARTLIIQHFSEALQKAKETNAGTYLLLDPSAGISKNDIALMIDAISNNVDMVIGVTSAKQNLATRIFNKKFSSSTTDPGSPISAFNDKVLESALGSPQTSLTEMTASALAQKLRVQECSIRTSEQ